MMAMILFTPIPKAYRQMVIFSEAHLFFCHNNLSAIGIGANKITALVPGANTIKSYPEIIWKSDSDRKLERFNLWSS